jgi:hypothetical protein
MQNPLDKLQLNSLRLGNRANSRRRVLKEGRIVIGRGWPNVPCAIRDTSPNGARLLVKAESKVPGRFELEFVSDLTFVPCELCWRRGDQLGVRYIGPLRKGPLY